MTTAPEPTEPPRGATCEDVEFLILAVGHVWRFTHNPRRVAEAALALADTLGIEDPVDLVARALREQIRAANV